MKTAASIASFVFACVLGAIPIVYAQQHQAAPRNISFSTCAAATSLQLANTTISSATVVMPGKFAPPQGPAAAFTDVPAFCRVSLTLKPSIDSNIKSELWLPLTGWNGKFQEV